MKHHHPRALALSLAAAALLLAAPAALAAPGGSLAGQVRVSKGGSLKSDHSRVVVYLEGVPNSKPKASARHELRQRNLQFTPQVTVVTKGSEVAFPNDDKIYHNVFSTSRSARFDLGLYRSGSSKSVQFKRKGVVDVFCNIHPKMVARVLVVDTVHYDETDRSGAFRIDGVPPGTYTAVVWQAHGEEVRKQVTIAPGKVTQLTVSLVEGEGPRQHRRKDGTPYGRYE